MATKTISIPTNLLDKMINAVEYFEDFNNEFEDFLLRHDNAFIKKMMKARNEHLKGKVKQISELKKELA